MLSSNPVVVCETLPSEFEEGGMHTMSLLDMSIQRNVVIGVGLGVKRASVNAFALERGEEALSDRADAPCTSRGRPVPHSCGGYLTARPIVSAMSFPREAVIGVFRPRLLLGLVALHGHCVRTQPADPCASNRRTRFGRLARHRSGSPRFRCRPLPCPRCRSARQHHTEPQGRGRHPPRRFPGGVSLVQRPCQREHDLITRLADQRGDGDTARPLSWASGPGSTS